MFATHALIIGAPAVSLRMTEPWQQNGTQSMLCISSLLCLKLASALCVWYLLLKACSNMVMSMLLHSFALQCNLALKYRPQVPDAYHSLDMLLIMIVCCSNLHAC